MTEQSLLTSLDALTALRAATRQRRLASVRQLLARQGGSHKVIRKGRGMEFAESRAYQPGDEVRLIDWKLTARTGKPHTKVFHEAHEQPLVLAIDQTGATCFASRRQLKASLGLKAAAALGWTALHQGEQVGGLVFSGHTHAVIPPGRGERPLLSLFHQALRLHEALRPAPRQPQPWQRALDELTTLAPAGARIILVGDLLAPGPGALDRLAQLRRRHSLLALHLFDPLEASLPDLGAVRLQWGDTELNLDLHDRKVRQNYALAYARQWQQVRERLLGLRIPAFSLSTHEEALDQLLEDGVLR
ncbi:DUF58 domain-containing protein [Sulfurivirga sp.]|uniref:DUF58 domain-containing protein n=1 Tax=Sulfurivirga sp. TaxID=2614236 RepID=UPI0025FD410C|nr:DUF58 domain-containing protein [Sulfurivirga sp.]